MLKKNLGKQFPSGGLQMAAPLMYVLYGQEAHEVEPGRLANVRESHGLHALLPVIFE